MKVPCPFKTPVLLIAFNRPQYTEQVIMAIRQAKPTSFYVAVDGPRVGVDEDAQAQEQIKKLLELVDWECDLHTLFRENNLGCGLGPSEAISWALANEDRIIVLEDDCVPNLSFFAFCDAMLERYRDDNRIGIISGRSYQHGSSFFDNQDYIFTHYAHTLGWATWKRCWDEFDIRMKDFPRYYEMGGALNVIPIKEAAKQSNKMLARIYNNIEREVTHSWDSQCVYMFLKNSQLGIVPCENLIEYIGWWGTHDKGVVSKEESMSTTELPDVLRHPKCIMTDVGYEKLHYKTHIKNINPSLLSRAIHKLLREGGKLFKNHSL